jgi:hypothetical protein
MNVSRERIFVTCPVLIHADTGILDAKYNYDKTVEAPCA